jgi:arylsulfatase A-like enzyme
MALLGAVFGASSGLAAEEKARDPGSRPNIVLFLSDDHGWADSGVYGDSYIRTPNMDRLAKESMLFTHAFAGAPLCNPSRHVIASGLMPMRNGHHLQGGGRKRSVSKWVSMPAHMRNLGYHTARIGKQGCGGGIRLQGEVRFLRLTKRLARETPEFLYSQLRQKATTVPRSVPLSTTYAMDQEHGI